MKLYDQKIQELLALSGRLTKSDIMRSKSWPVVSKEELILKSDMAAELGGGTHHAVTGLAYTTNETLVAESGVWVIGDGDLTRIKECDFGRFILIRLKTEFDEKEQQELYARFRKLDYLRYHLFLKGISARISSVAHREVLRISKEAAGAGITLEAMGKTWVEAYLKMDEVAAVQIFYYVNAGESSYYKKLEEMAAACEEITESLNVIFQGVSMDCNTCGQKAICDAVEGLSKMHEELLKKK